MKEKIIHTLKNEATLIIATLVAVSSMFFVPPSISYIDYIDFKVIALLFCLMAVVAGFRRIHLFAAISGKLLREPKDMKQVTFILVNCTFLFAMFITNDVALIMMVPLTVGLLKDKASNHLIFVVVMETIAANLGSMLTPIGNPQNLYLYSYYHMNIGDFLKIVLPVGLASFLLVNGIIWIVAKKDGDTIYTEETKITSGDKLILYLGLFLLCLLTVGNIIDYRICLGVVIIGIFLKDKKIFQYVDYSLLLTFVMFFVFVGNLGQIETVKQFFSTILKGRELGVGIVASQLISNVPAAVMLSGFTTDVGNLLLGVNIGGLGTLIASLASLISFRIYSKAENANNQQYLLAFSVYNMIMLAGLIIFVIVWQ